MAIVMKMQANSLRPELPALCLSAFVAEVCLGPWIVASASFLCSYSLLTWECILTMEYSESTSPLPCGGGGTAGVSAISYTGESKLGSIYDFIFRNEIPHSFF
jgi:hypothetical protein